MNKIFKASFILTLIVIISKLFGFLRELVVSYFYGASAITDAFYVSTLIPNFFYLIVLQAISVAFIPVILQMEKETDVETSSSFTSKLVIVLSFFCIGIALIISLCSKWLISLFAPGFDENTCVLGGELLQISAWFLLLQAPVSIFSAYSQARKKFIIPAIFGLITDITYIVCVIISFYTKYVIILGFVPIISIVLEFILIIPVVRKNGFKFTLEKKIGKYLKLFLFISIPTILTVGASQLNTFVGKIIGSKIAEGAISSFNYAWNICNLYESLFISSVCVVLFSELSELIVDKEKNLLRITTIFNNSFRIVGYSVIILSCFTSAFSEDLVRLIYGRGSFGETAITLTSDCLSIIALSSVFYVLNNLGIRYLYAEKKTLISTIFACCSLLTGVVLNLILFYFSNLGIKGIAIATAITNVVNCLLTYFYIIIKIKIELNKSVLRVCLWFAVCVISSYSLFILKKILLPSSNWITIVSGITYLIIILSILCCYEWKNIKLFLKKKSLH